MKVKEGAIGRGGGGKEKGGAPVGRPALRVSRKDYFGISPPGAGAGAAPPPLDEPPAWFSA